MLSKYSSFSLLFGITIKFDLVVKLQVAVDDLEKFSRLRYPACLQLGPDWHVVERDLESTRLHELTLYEVGQEEEHHAGIEFIFRAPDPPRWPWLVDVFEDVDATEDTENDDHL